MSEKCLFNSDELKELKTKLRNAYTIKALDAQIAEKEANRAVELSRDKLSLKLMRISDENTTKQEVHKNNEKTKKREEYRAVLKTQIEEKYVKKIQQEEADKKEREVLIKVDELIDKEFEIIKKNKRDELRETLRRERLIFEKMREVKKAMEIEMEEIASIKESVYEAEIMRRSMEMKKLMDDQRKKRELVITRVAELFVDNETLKIERESLITDLIAEEIRQQLLIEEHETEFKIKEKRRKLAEDLKEQMMFSVESEERYRQLDRVFADNVMMKIMENERLWILTAEARRRKQMIYKEDLGKLIEERRRIRENAVAVLKDEWREGRMREEIRRQEIKEERQRLIQEHAEHVGGYLKAILSNEEDELMEKS